MIEFRQGNLLEAKAEALVNAVNCVGIMGKGIALQFKKAFPENYKQYEKACHNKEVKPGQMFTTSTGLLQPKYIINFPTKRHWRENSRIEDVEIGLRALAQEVQQLKINSIAIPALGCGNGGLDWEEVSLLLLSTFIQIPEIDVFIFAPSI